MSNSDIFAQKSKDKTEETVEKSNLAQAEPEEQVETYINPIYDAAFKYLMQHERASKIILSAILGTEILDIAPSSEEYTTKISEALHIHRYDFRAVVTLQNGEQILVLTEMQKTFCEANVGRFQGYAMDNYAEKTFTDKNGLRLPMFATYIIGNHIGKCNHGYYNMMSLPFSLYDSQNDDLAEMYRNLGQFITVGFIVVQIPYFNRSANKAVSKIFQIFDQSYVYSKEKRTLKVGDRDFTSDDDVKYLIELLKTGKSDNDLMEELKNELKYYDEKAMYDQVIAEKDEKLAEKDEKLAEKDEKLAEQDEKLAEQDAIIATLRNELQKLSGKAS